MHHRQSLGRMLSEGAVLPHCLLRLDMGLGRVQTATPNLCVVMKLDMGRVRAHLGLRSGGCQALIAMALLMGGDYFIRGAERIGPKQVRRPAAQQVCTASSRHGQDAFGVALCSQSSSAATCRCVAARGGRRVMQRSREGRAQAGAELCRLPQKLAAHSLALLPLLISTDYTSCSEHQRQGVPVCCKKDTVEYWGCSCPCCKGGEERCRM